MTYRESLLLTGEAWPSLDDSKKIQVLQAIENHMAAESKRIPSPVEGRFLHTGTDGVVMGQYDPRTGRIYINTSQFDPESMYGKDSAPIVTACLHEGRHAYQHQVADGLVAHDDPNEAEAWRENLKEGSYISFRQDPRGYYEQPVEADARDFAARRYKELETERLQAEMDRPDDCCAAKNAFEEQIEGIENGSAGMAASYQQAQTAMQQTGGLRQ